MVGWNGRLTGLGEDLTKYAPPLIIIRGVGAVCHKGWRDPPTSRRARQEVRKMRVMVEKARRGVRRITVLPAQRTRLAPVQVQGANRDTVLGEVAGVIRDVDKVEYPPAAEPV